MKRLEMDKPAFTNLAHTASQLEFFSALKGAEIDAILSQIQLYAWDRGETIFKRGSEADALYIVYEGQVKIRLNSWFALFRKSAHLGPGNMFGEMGLLEDKPRSATAVAAAPVKLFVLFRNEFSDLLNRSPAFAAGVRLLAERRHFEASH